MPFKSESMPDAESRILDWIDLGAPYAAPLAAEGATRAGRRPTRGH
jgi:hypothetical protein